MIIFCKKGFRSVPFLFIFTCFCCIFPDIKSILLLICNYLFEVEYFSTPLGMRHFFSPYFPKTRSFHKPPQKFQKKKILEWMLLTRFMSVVRIAKRARRFDALSPHLKKKKKLAESNIIQSKFGYAPSHALMKPIWKSILRQHHASTWIANFLKVKSGPLVEMAQWNNIEDFFFLKFRSLITGTWMRLDFR